MTDSLPSVSAPPAPCARCGREADFDIASLWLCIDCYHIAGSTCAGIGHAPATARHPGPGPGSGATIDEQVC